METHGVFLLHSPYGDGSWRGLEKCAGAAGDGMVSTSINPAGTLAFSTREDAEAFAQKWNLVGMHVVEAALVVPSVRQRLDSVRAAIVDDDLWGHR